MSTIRLLAMTAFLFFAMVSSAYAAPIRNADEIAARLGLSEYAHTKSTRTLKIAILDNGFRDAAAQVGVSLPASTQIRTAPLPVDPAAEDSHGLAMAQIVSSLLAKTPLISYELHLFTTFGYTNLENAVHTVINEQFDIVLYAQVWEYGGNGDGRGFINALVNKATSAGLLWINAAGNFADSTFSQNVVRGQDDWADLPAANDTVRVRCHQNPRGVCKLRAVLTWNDFKDDVKEGTDKDLDLVLSDDTLKILRTGGLTQVREINPPGQPGLSLYPREIVEAEVKPGLYNLRVKIRSNNVTTSDRLKILASGDYVELVDRTGGDETLLSPADNASVITVGASDSEKSSRSSARAKPEFLAVSEVRTENDDIYKGSSNSTAMATVLVAIYKSMNAAATREDVIGFLRDHSSGQGHHPGSQAPLSMLQVQFLPTGQGCFFTAHLPATDSTLQTIMHQGGIAVHSSHGFKVFTSFDPISFAAPLQRRNTNDVLVYSVGRGFYLAPRSAQGSLRPNEFEVLQKPFDAYYCGFDGRPI